MAREIKTLTVLRRSRLSPHMVRVVLGGDGFSSFEVSRYSDSYVKLVFSPAGVELGDSFDLDAAHALPEAQRPVLRTYTVRRVDHTAKEVWIDFVIHGDSGVAGPWAAAAEPGETVRYVGPGGAYAPDPAADVHLLAGDLSALPAISAAVEALPDDARAQVFVEADGPADEIALNGGPGVTVTWLHRGPDSGVGVRAPLVAAVREWPWPGGDVAAFAHGEAEAVMHGIRPYLRKERGLSAARASISGYWRIGRTEEGFRDWKSELARTESAAQG